MESVNEYNNASQNYESLMAKYMDAQAGMLGQNLKEGEPCPVCGSTSHPHITEVKDEIPSEKDLKNAKNLRQKKEEKRSEISGNLRAKITEIDSLKERIDDVVNENPNEFAESIDENSFNILEENSVRNAFNLVVRLSSKIDLLVCCAGGGAREKSCAFIEQDMNVVDSVLNVNLRGGILCTKEACKYMVSRGKGKIIIISSTVGLQGMPAYSEYAAAKAGLMAFVKSIAMELGKNGIRINCVTPGIVQRGSIDENQMERIKKTNWVNDYGKPEDISNMIAFLNSDEATFITGQNFVVDGGRSLGLKNN